MEDNEFAGRIEVRPPLNEAERDHLFALAASSSTLRGTPTGRGDGTVPFAHLAWQPCESGCCLTWDGTERAEHLMASLVFVVDHLLRPGAKAQGHRRFPGFTCDHVLDGVVAATGRSGHLYVAEVSGNRVSGASSQPACAQAGTGSTSRSRPRPRPANVIEFRPRRA